MRFELEGSFDIKDNISSSRKDKVRQEIIRDILKVFENHQADLDDYTFYPYRSRDEIDKDNYEM